MASAFELHYSIHLPKETLETEIDTLNNENTNKPTIKSLIESALSTTLAIPDDIDNARHFEFVDKPYALYLLIDRIFNNYIFYNVESVGRYDTVYYFIDWVGNPVNVQINANWNSIQVTQNLTTTEWQHRFNIDKLPGDRAYTVKTVLLPKKRTFSEKFKYYKCMQCIEFPVVSLNIDFIRKINDTPTEHTYEVFTTGLFNKAYYRIIHTAFDSGDILISNLGTHITKNKFTVPLSTFMQSNNYTLQVKLCHESDFHATLCVTKTFGSVAIYPVIETITGYTEDLNEIIIDIDYDPDNTITDILIYVDYLDRPITEPSFNFNNFYDQSCWIPAVVNGGFTQLTIQIDNANPKYRIPNVDHVLYIMLLKPGFDFEFLVTNFHYFPLTNIIDPPKIDTCAYIYDIDYVYIDITTTGDFVDIYFQAQGYNTWTLLPVGQFVAGTITLEFDVDLPYPTAGTPVLLDLVLLTNREPIISMDQDAVAIKTVTITV
jgi:hypothetical protein